MQLALLICLLTAGSDPVDTAVVCPAEFRQALEPWLAHRRAQGRRVSLVSNVKSADAIRRNIRQLAAAGKLRYVLIVGDADPAMFASAAARERSVPAHYAQAVVNARFGSSPEIASDNWYADLDDDRLPDVAVGRIPSDSPEELALAVRKILDYERSADFGEWRRQVHFVAGLGGFGAVADAVLEAAAKSLIGEGIPPAYATTMTYGSWQSPYCPDPRQFQRVTIERLNQGSLFWVYIGHGAQRTVDEVHVPGAHYPIFSSRETALLACRRGAPIACLLSCYGGAYDQPRDCLAEDMLRAPGGPVAVLCGSRVTMPYAMSVMGLELLEACFNQRAETLGEALLVAKRRMMHPEPGNRRRAVLDAAAKALSPTAGELEAECAEHLDLFNLLGDPLLKIGYPRKIELGLSATAIAGETVELAIDTPLAGAAVVEVAVRRDRLTFRPPARAQFDAAAMATYGDIYRRANEPRLSVVEVALAKGRSSSRIRIPDEARGACHVRVFVEGTEGCAAGAADVRVAAPE
jgi:Peptidase family C25